MINIQIDRTGKVSGDTNTVAATETDKYSQPIRVLHPDFPHVIHKIRYRQGRLEAFDIINRDDIFRFIVDGPGTVRMQYIAEDVHTGEPILTSETFRLDVSKSIRKPCGEDPSHRLHTPHILDLEIVKLTDRLKEVGIIPSHRQEVIGDCNFLTNDREYILSEGSTNTPEGENKSSKRYLMRVRNIDNLILQTAHLLVSGGKAIFYRTGYKSDKSVCTCKSVYTWTDWDAILYNNTASVVESENSETIPFKPGQFVVVKSSDNAYSLYYDVSSGSDIEDRILISSGGGSSLSNIINITDSSYENNVYEISCDEIDVPYAGMICIFTPRHDMDSSASNNIKFNEDISGIYTRNESGSLVILDKPVLKADVPVLMIYSNKRWIVDSPTLTNTSENVDKIINIFDFENNVIKDDAIPESVERIENKVTTLSDDIIYSDYQYPTAKATIDYVNSKLGESYNDVTTNIVTSNAPSSIRDFINVLLSYINHSEELVYGTECTALDAICTNEINAVSLIELGLRGIDYDHSLYVSNENISTHSYACRLMSPETKYTANSLFSFAKKHDAVFKTTSWQDILPGDVIVYTDSSEIDQFSVYIGNCGSYKLMIVSRNSNNPISCERLNMSDTPDYVIRFPLNFVNELYPFNLISDGEESIAVNSSSSKTYYLDSNLVIDIPYTVNCKITINKGESLIINNESCYYASADIIDSYVTFPYIPNSESSFELTTSSLLDVKVSDFQLYEGLLDAPERYDIPLSSRDTNAVNSILVYTE